MWFCFTDLWADQQCCLAKMTRKGWLKSPSWNFLGALLMKINLKGSKHLSLFPREGAWVTHDVVVAYLNIFLYLSMISTLSPDFCFCNVFCHRLVLLYIYSEFSRERGKEENEGRWWKKKINSLFVSHASNQRCRFMPFFYIKRLEKNQSA